MTKNAEKYFHTQMDRTAGLTHTFHKTKIVATVGPACDTYDKLLELVKAGVNVFRLNFSHGTHENKAEIINHIRKINKTEPYNISILGDLQGPKLRVGEIENGSLKIEPGDILTFTSREKVVGTKEKIYISYPDLHKDVKTGEKIMIDDGKLEVVVTEITPNDEVKVRVTYGGNLLPKKGVNLPDTAISLPAMTPKDIEDFEFIIKHELDWVALSFVRRAEDIIDLKTRSGFQEQYKSDGKDRNAICPHRPAQYHSRIRRCNGGPRRPGCGTARRESAHGPARDHPQMYPPRQTRGSSHTDDGKYDRPRKTQPQ